LTNYRCKSNFQFSQQWNTHKCKTSTYIPLGTCGRKDFSPWVRNCTRMSCSEADIQPSLDSIFSRQCQQTSSTMSSSTTTSSTVHPSTSSIVTTIAQTSSTTNSSTVIPTPTCTKFSNGTGVICNGTYPIRNFTAPDPYIGNNSAPRVSLGGLDWFLEVVVISFLV